MNKNHPNIRSVGVRASYQVGTGTAISTVEVMRAIRGDARRHRDLILTRDAARRRLLASIVRAERTVGLLNFKKKNNRCQCAGS